MSKVKLQEFCQKRAWDLPLYDLIHEGPPHKPLFKALVVVNGVSFEAPSFSNRVKDAQNAAAKVALEHYFKDKDRNGEKSRPLCPEASTRIDFRLALVSEVIPKVKLQELCQKKRWNLPVYDCIYEGPPHTRFFKVTVMVNGIAFQAPHFLRRFKDAQNQAAKLAFDHFVENEAPIEVKDQPLSPGNLGFKSGVSVASCEKSGVREGCLVKGSGESSEASADTENSNESEGAGRVSDERISTRKRGLVEEVAMAPQDLNQMPEETLDAKRHKVSGGVKLFKSLLNIFVQKKGLDPPSYTFEVQGPHHATKIKSKVTVGGKTYESLHFFRKLRDAEHAAADVALSVLLANEAGHRDMIGNTVSRHLLRQLADNSGLEVPKYNVTSSGASHVLTFVAMVEVGGRTFTGKTATTKKQAESNAARDAYGCLCDGASASKLTGIITTDSQESNKEGPLSWT